MKKLISLTFAISIMAVTAAVALPAQARDTQYMLSVEDGLNTTDADAKLDGSVKFYFAGQKHPAVLQKFGSDASNLKTNSFGKPDEVACKWVFLSVLVQFEKRAKELGANAVINIVSNYKKNEFASATQFECHAGAIVAGVALKGDFVKIGNK
jgi:hypothetical protein